MNMLEEKVLGIIEKNSRVSTREMAVVLGTEEIDVINAQRGKGFDDIAERIYKYPEVNSVYLISGGYDLMVTLEGKSLKEVSRFVSSKLSTLDTVISTATHFILKKYKDHGTIMTRKYEDQREIITP